ncbi:hypothetical protein KBC31_01545 [Candidatus Saccharibacteria bacterium]|jgi:hypothetical protein|nr:hypothetical protein [Candidatus Saccharibacteria bacterium]
MKTNKNEGFQPELTPKQMLELGIFGGNYFAAKDIEEFPKGWFKNVKMNFTKTDKMLNYFEVNASQSREEWQRKGWIFDIDPLGWVQWYFRYYQGRRVPEMDEIQIKRWWQMKRHIAQIEKNCQKGDLACRRRQRQALLHWAYDSIHF